MEAFLAIVLNIAVGVAVGFFLGRQHERRKGG